MTLMQKCMLTLIYLNSSMYLCNLLCVHLTYINRCSVLYTIGLKGAEFLVICFSSELHGSDLVTLSDSKLPLMSVRVYVINDSKFKHDSCNFLDRVAMVHFC